MKTHTDKICTFFIACIGLFLFAENTLQAQTPTPREEVGTWKHLHPYPMSNNPRDVHFVNADTGWIVGDQGLILHTEDGGRHWTSQSKTDIGSGKDLESVYFMNADTGWIVGWSGSMLYTKNGGKTWKRPSITHSDPINRSNIELKRVHFANKDMGWSVGDKGVILCTTNGGATWVQQGNPAIYASGRDTTLYDVHFTDADKGWAVGGRQGYASLLLSTENGGEDWVEKTSPLSRSTLKSVAFVSPQKGWVVGEGSAPMYTENGGATWESIRLPANAPRERWTGIHLYGEDNIWVTSERGVLHSADGGTVWEISSRSGAYGVHFINEKMGWMVGNGIQHTIDAGIHWEQLIKRTSWESLRDVAFMDENKGWTVGGRGAILHTTDGGTSWEKQRSHTTLTFHTTKFMTPDKGWIAGDKAGILHTTNGGVFWKKQKIEKPEQVPSTLRYVTPEHLIIKDMFFANEMVGWIVGEGFVAKTINGGDEWIIQPAAFFSNSGITFSSYQGVHFINVDTGWVVGRSATVLKTENGGDNWVRQDMGIVLSNATFKDVVFLDKDNGWIVGEEGGNKGIILRTTDGGLTWQAQRGGLSAIDFARSVQARPYVDISAASPMDAHVVGHEGRMVQTKDGGQVWAEQNSFDGKELHATFFKDATNGWAVGEDARVMKYEVQEREVPKFSVTTSDAKAVELHRSGGNETAIIIKEEGSGTISFNVKSAMPWSAVLIGSLVSGYKEVSHDGITISPSSGSGDATVEYRYSNIEGSLSSTEGSHPLLFQTDDGQYSYAFVIRFFPSEGDFLIYPTDNLVEVEAMGNYYGITVRKSTDGWRIADGGTDWINFRALDNVRRWTNWADGFSSALIPVDGIPERVLVNYASNLEIDVPRETTITFTSEALEAPREITLRQKGPPFLVDGRIDRVKRIEVNGASGSLTFPVASNTAWEASYALLSPLIPDWITRFSDGVTEVGDGILSSTGNKILEIAYKENDVIRDRQQIFIVRSLVPNRNFALRVLLHQERATERNLSHESGSFQIVIPTLRTFVWTVNDGNVDWIEKLTLLNGGDPISDPDEVFGRGYDTLLVDYVENPIFFPRETDIVFTIENTLFSITERIPLYVHQAEKPRPIAVAVNADVDTNVLPYQGGVMAVSISVPEGMPSLSDNPWTVELGGTDAEWVTNLSDGNGQSVTSRLENSTSEALTVTYAENPTGTPRTARLTFMVGNEDVYIINVRQVGRPTLTTTVDGALNALPYTQGTFQVQVEAKTDWTVTLSGEQDVQEFVIGLEDGTTWGISHTGELVSDENKVLTVEYSENPTTTARQATITFSATDLLPDPSQVIRFTQQPHPALTVTPPTATDLTALAMEGGSFTIEVLSNTTWTVTDRGAPWISELSDGTASHHAVLTSDGNKTLTVHYLPNTSTNQPQAVLRFTADGVTSEASHTLRLTQARGVGAPFLEVDPPATTSLTHAQGSFTVNVRSNTDWILRIGGTHRDMIAELSDGTNLSDEERRLRSRGNKTVTVTYTENPIILPRAAILSFTATAVRSRASHIIRISQEEGLPTLLVTPQVGVALDDLSYARNGSFTVAVRSNTAWTVRAGGSDATTLVQRLSIGSNTHATELNSDGDKNLRVFYTANATAVSREATLFFTAEGVAESPSHRVVFMQGPTPTLSITPANLIDLGPEEGSFEVVVSANIDWRVKAAGRDAVGFITTLSDGTVSHASELISHGDKTLTVNYAANDDVTQTRKLATLSFSAVGATISSSPTLVITQRGLLLGTAEDYFSGLLVYPVPASDLLHIESPEDATVRIYDARNALTGTYIVLAEQAYTISLEACKTGVYLLEIQTKKGRLVRRFMKK